MRESIVECGKTLKALFVLIVLLFATRIERMAARAVDWAAAENRKELREFRAIDE